VPDTPQPIIRTGRTLSGSPGLCTLYRVTGPGWKAHERVGVMASPALAEAVCAAVNAYGRPLPPAPGLDGASVQLAAEAMLRQYKSQYSAGHHFTWRDFADDARAILEAALLPGSGEGSGDG
jgi:hypothetical protein